MMMPAPSSIVLPFEKALQDDEAAIYDDCSYYAHPFVNNI